MKSEIFEHEIDVAKKSTEILLDDKISKDSLHTQYKILNKEYKTLLRNFKKVTRIGDSSSRKLLKAQQTIEKKNAELKKLMASKDRIFSIIAHDLRGPIGNIKLFFDLMAETFDSLNPDNFNLLISDFKRSIGATYTLLENLLAWANTERGAILFQPEKLIIKKIIQSNIELLTETAKSKKITFDIKTIVDETIYADEHMASTVIRNLISNAIKFSLKKGCIQIKTEKLKNNFITISVADNGIGIEKENIKKLFDENQNFTTPGTNNETGSGLGLLLCNEFIKKNNGIISVESVVNEGTTFKITLPMDKI